VEPSTTDLENMNPNFVLHQIETRVGSDRSVAVLRHLLTYTDGAAILDAQARAIGIGAQLKYSEASKRSLHCPVCGNFLYWVRCSNLDVYVVKA
jgi:hypothetical protein